MEWDPVNALSDGILILDKDLKVHNFNDGILRITGFSPAELKERDLSDILKLPFPIEQLKEKKLFTNVEAGLVTKENTEVSVLVSISPVFSTDSQIKSYMIVIRNIFEYLFLLRQLIQERNFKEAILESIVDGAFSVDKDFKITSFNRAAEEITRFSKEEAIGRLCSDVIRSEACSKTCPLKKTMENKENIKNFETTIIRKDGAKIPVSINTAVLYDENGEFIGGVETFRDISEIKRLRKEIRERYSFGSIIGKSAVMQKIYDKLETISPTDANVLIEGETGTGKDLIAKTIHYNSLRKDKPFVKINCAAIPENLIESELFGYKRGAFTGAIMDKIGKFEAADKGTFFLDEIGDLPLSLQAKLLRAIEDKEFERLGEVKSRKVDVRIIAATNRHLRELTKSGKFRKDLFYRLNVVNIFIPPLRERSDDIPLLIEHFIEAYNRKFKKNVRGVEQRVMDFALDYEWPGNIRELENVVEHSMIHAKGSLITFEDLPDYIFEEKEISSGRTLFEKEKDYILKVLKENNYNKKKTSEILGISRTTLWRKLKKLGID